MENKIDKKVVTYVLIAIVAVILIFSIVQTIALNELQQTLVENVFSGITSNIQASAPTMVGGC